MPRPKGSRNKAHKDPRKTVAVRLTAEELARLLTVDPSPSEAIHSLIARLT